MGSQVFALRYFLRVVHEEDKTVVAPGVHIRFLIDYKYRYIEV
jgi:hypothetical protein